ncbi:MAG: glycosyltransferase [Lachnospiraceae bacterium]|nr:glycosyltransferase [Lachnospiraceae bacterium]
MPKCSLSVIVTIYNAEKDLHIMLDSLAAQDIEDVEFILIDNGSEDQSGRICEQYAAKDSRFRVEVIEQNIGYIGTRNYGLSICRGEYFTFADADDHVAEAAYSTLIGLAKENAADWVIAPYYQENTDGTNQLIPLNIPAGVYKDKDIRNTIIPVVFGPNKDGIILNGFMWRMIFRTKLARQLGIKFSEEAKPREDQLFNQTIACSAKTVVVCEFPVYYYRVNPNSVTALLVHSFDLKRECETLKYFYETSIKNMEGGKAEDAAVYSVYANFFRTIYAICLNCAKTDSFAKLKEDAQILESYFPRKLLDTACEIRKRGKMSGTEKIEHMCLSFGGIVCLLRVIKVGVLLRRKTV